MGAYVENKKPPNLLIIGVHKAGTTSVFEYLSAHPEVCGSRKKELHYYTPLRFNRPLTDFDDYLSKFSHCRKVKYRLEASPSYLYGKGKIGGRIRNDLGNVKLILILRDPVSRFISFYKSLKTTLRLDVKTEFDNFLEDSVKASSGEESEDVYFRGFQEGLYSEYIKDWIKMFDRNSLKIVFFEHLKDDPSRFMIELADWLSIDGTLYKDTGLFKISNRTRMPSSIMVHKFAMLMNKRFEFFFRSQKRLKQSLREFYFKINREEDMEIISEASVKRVKDLYIGETIKLKQILDNPVSYTHLTLPTNREV